MIPKKWLFSLGFACLMLIFSIATAFLPWWRIYSSREGEIDTNTAIRVEYNLLGSITSSKITTVENESISTTISISELNATEDNKNALQSLFNILWYLTIAGSGLNILILVLVCVSNVQLLSLHKYIKYLTVITAILFFVAFLYFASEAQPNISKLQRIAPTEVHTLLGSQIQSLFGTTDSLIYGPSLGWYLALVVSLLNVSFYMLIEKIEKMS